MMMQKVENKFNLRNLVSVNIHINDPLKDWYRYVPEVKPKTRFLFFKVKGRLEGFELYGYRYIPMSDVKEEFGENFFVHKNRIIHKPYVKLVFSNNEEFLRYFETESQANHFYQLIRSFKRSVDKNNFFVGHSIDRSLLENFFYL